MPDPEHQQSNDDWWKPPGRRVLRFVARFIAGLICCAVTVLVALWIGWNLSWWQSAKWYSRLLILPAVGMGLLVYFALELFIFWLLFEKSPKDAKFTAEMLKRLNGDGADR